MTKVQSNSHISKISILLTATIDPKGVVLVQRNEPVVRENDYISSIRRWTETDITDISSIVFCENSGYNLDKIKTLLANYSTLEAEVLQFSGQGYAKELGKGYGELLILRHAIQHSNLIKNSDYVIKITGRYFIKNISKITSPLMKENNIFVMADLKRNLTWADSHVFAFKPLFVLNYLSEFQDLLNDSKGFYFEHALARAILRSIADGYKWIPLPSKPIISGYYATADVPYKTSKIHWLPREAIHRVKNYLNRR